MEATTSRSTRSGLARHVALQSQDRPAGAAEMPNDGLDADTDAFYREITALIRLYMLRDRDRVCTHGMSVTECYALDALVRLGPLTVTGLAYELGVNKSTASRVVDSLATKGLVERTDDPTDYKAKQVRPTSEGLERNGAVVADIKAEHRALLSGFTPAARREATRLLEAVTAAAAPRIRPGDSMRCEEAEPGAQLQAPEHA